MQRHAFACEERATCTFEASNAVVRHTHCRSMLLVQLSIASCTSLYFRRKDITRSALAEGGSVGNWRAAR